MSKVTRGLNRTAIEQVIVNVDALERALKMIKEEQSPLLPSPLTLAMAELANVRRYALEAQRECRAVREA